MAIDAVRTLDPYLTQHPQNHERLLVALKAIYEARSAGQSITTAAEDRARFERYATAVRPHENWTARRV